MADPSSKARPSLSSRASVPPSEPRSTRGSFEAIDAHIERPARLQIVVALFLVLVLVVIPLYLWRRPRAEAIAVTPGAVDAGALPAVSAAPTAPVTEDKLVLGEPKILSCHDPGPKKTAPEQCDHVVELEKGFAKAIEDSASCVPREAGGGSVIYVLDVTFKKKNALALATPREGRTLKSGKAVSACEKAVRAKASALPYDAMKHEHARYRVAITATYPGSVK